MSGFCKAFRNVAAIVLAGIGVSLEGASTLANLNITNEVYTAAQTDQRIVELAPPPADYQAVSNAAMNARSATDLGVRGAPRAGTDWFVVNGEPCGWEDSEPEGWYGPVLITTNATGYALSYGPEDVQFILDDNYSATVFAAGEEFYIIGYVDTLAQVSQLSGFLSTTGGVIQSSNGGQTILRMRGAFMQGCSTVNAVGICAHAEGTNTTAVGEHSHVEGRETRAEANAPFSHAEGYGTRTGLDTASGIGARGSHAEGWRTRASGRGSHSDGTFSVSSNDVAYTWSGTTNNSSESTWYGSHGDGTFNINPIGGLDGFWVGNNKLGSLMGFRMVTPTGEWQFTAFPDGYSYVSGPTWDEDDTVWELQYKNDSTGIVGSGEVTGYATDTTITFSVGGSTVTATRVYPLQNRSINSLVCQAATTIFLQFPPAIDNMARDFYVRLTLETNSSSVGVAKFDTSVSYETADGNWPDFSTGGTYIVRLTETAPSVWESEISGATGLEVQSITYANGTWTCIVTDGSITSTSTTSGSADATSLTFSGDFVAISYTVTATLSKPVFLLNSQPAKQAMQP